MTLDDLTRSTGEWLRGDGPMSEVVISSRVRLARNLAEYPFLSTASSSEQTEIYRCLADQTTSASAMPDMLLVDVDAANSLDRGVLVERHLISTQHAAGEGSRGVAISRDETLALMINEEDHLRIQGLRSGLQLEPLWEVVSKADDAISAGLAFAFDRRYGYLTACPTNLGTGIRVSVMLHLPALRITNEIERVLRAARDMRLAVRGMYGEGTDAIGDFYQISNQITLGQSEDEIIRSFGEQIIPDIVAYEKASRDALASEQPYNLDDKIWRAFGVLSNARRIGTEETQALLSALRMGIHIGRFDKLDIPALNELFLKTQPAHLQRTHNRSLDEDEQAVVRAELLRSRLVK